MTPLRIADYEDYINALPDGNEEKEAYRIANLDTEPVNEDYHEACEQAEQRADAQQYETERYQAKTGDGYLVRP